MSFDPSLAFIRCPRHCDVATPPEAVGMGRYVCTGCAFEFDSGIRPGASREMGTTPSRRRSAAPAGSLMAALILFASIASAQTVPVLPDCRVTGIPKPYADGDYRLTIRCERNGTQTPVVGDKASVQRVVVPPPPTETIWGPVDPDVLGDFTAAEHDNFTVSGGDGFRYRVWHPQCPVIQNGVLRCYAHEHGDDPATIGDAWVKSMWDGRFGYAARRYKHHPGEPDGHLEAHEGFKVFVANKGDTNDEGRVNRTWTLAYVHMGTFRPGRFNTEPHSGSLASRHDFPGDQEMRLKFHLLLETGGTDVVCDPRHDAPIKDVMALGSRCLLNSPYEIWGMTQTIREAGASQEIARVFQTPASFRPVTVLNPANRTEVVYADDPRVAAIKRFPGDNWSGFKDDVRETYAQNPYLYTGNRTTDIYWTDPTGLVVPSTDPNAIQQYVQRGINRISLPSTQDNLQFKMKVDYGRGCEPDRDGNCQRPRAGITGKVSYAKLGFKN